MDVEHALNMCIHTTLVSTVSTQGRDLVCLSVCLCLTFAIHTYHIIPMSVHFPREQLFPTFHSHVHFRYHASQIAHNIFIELIHLSFTVVFHPGVKSTLRACVNA